jgi:hypothetical protein
VIARVRPCVRPLPGRGVPAVNGVYRWTEADVLTKVPFSSASQGGTVVPSAMEALVANSRALQQKPFKVERQGSHWYIWQPPEKVLFTAAGRDVVGTLPPSIGWTNRTGGTVPTPPTLSTQGASPPGPAPTGAAVRVQDYAGAAPMLPSCMSI